MHLLFPIGGESYSVPFSLRVRRSASAYLSFTPAVAGNRRTFGISLPVRRGAAFASRQTLFSAGSDASNFTALEFDANGRLRFYRVVGGATTVYFLTNEIFQDPISFAHTCVRFDTPQATASARMTLEVNGVAISSFNTVNYPAQNFDEPHINTTVLHTLGVDRGGLGTYFDGQFAEPIFVDGQAPAASAYYRFKPATGKWVPRRYIGHFGRNGWQLKFADATAATAAAIGKDSAPIDAVHTTANNWTPNNISVTTGFNFDQLLDSPTRVFCVMNPLTPGADGFSNGNLKLDPYYGSLGTIGVDSGAFVFEGAFVQFPDSTSSSGIGITSQSGERRYIRSRSADFAAKVSAAGETTGLAFWGGSDIARIEFDVTNNRFAIYRNGALVMESLAAGLSGQTWWPEIQAQPGPQQPSWQMNFGQRAFVGTPTGGYQPISTDALAAGGAITSGTFTGNASANGQVVQLKGTPETLTINGNPVTWGTHALRTASGFKVITSNASYNAAGSNSFVATIRTPFVSPAKAINNAQVN